MRFDLSTKYEERELVKAYGAKFDWNKRVWYYEGASLPDDLKRWYTAATTSASSSASSASTAVAVSSSASSAPTAVAVSPSASSAPTIKGKACRNVFDVIESFNLHMKTTPLFKSVAVVGEVTNCRTPNPNLFFSIKDIRETNDPSKKALLNCMMWASAVNARLGKTVLKNGDEVCVIGEYLIYKDGGKAQLYIEDIIILGDGPFGLAYVQLKDKLEKEGLFDLARKKPLPKYARSVGIITSKDGAVIGDIMDQARKYNPYLTAELYHVRVQGRNAVPSIIAGLKVMDSQGYDVIILGRGGGSDDELFCYNDETLVRFVAGMKTPTISAIGHNIHRTLTDMVSDYFAVTPTDAGVKAFWDVFNVLDSIDDKYGQMYRSIIRRMAGESKNLDEYGQRMYRSITRRLGEEKKDLDMYRRQMQMSIDRRVGEFSKTVDLKRETLERYNPKVRYIQRLERTQRAASDLDRGIRSVLEGKRHYLERSTGALRANSPVLKFDRMKTRIENLSENLRRKIEKSIADRTTRFDLTLTKLNGLSPTAKLVNGFGYVSKDGMAVTTISDVAPGDEVSITVRDGHILTQVKAIEGGTIMTQS